MRAMDETDRLLELLREAGEEPVTLDELHVVGVRDPAAALLALELAGHGVERVVDGRATCVRLARAEAEPAPRRDARPLLVLAAALLVVLVATRRR
jgi:hypothetical protein